MGTVQHWTCKAPPRRQPGKSEGQKRRQVQRDEWLGRGHTPVGTRSKWKEREISRFPGRASSTAAQRISRGPQPLAAQLSSRSCPSSSAMLPFAGSVALTGIVPASTGPIATGPFGWLWAPHP